MTLLWTSKNQHYKWQFISSQRVNGNAKKSKVHFSWLNVKPLQNTVSL
ncbi:hypothetical protein B4U80_07834 [Leptotrombidium deliense]|uniref:Uncharacterized protein n=1 Tax=Leptotrombidium deliense TaxID=299467 RepID=A0A443SD18_9ACAR|nr:hypothetical protein B4U80_07834 [Leptotrombidium deliense]